MSEQKSIMLKLDQGQIRSIELVGQGIILGKLQLYLNSEQAKLLIELLEEGKQLTKPPTTEYVR